MERNLSDNLTARPGSDVEHEKLSREELLALLKDVVDQRDKLLAQYESMALQTNESSHDVDELRVDTQHYAKRAEESEQRAEKEAARANELTRQLDDERKKTAEVVAEFARFRREAEQPRMEDPWWTLWLAISQIVGGWVAWVRSKIPQDSPLLPWFDKLIAASITIGRLAVQAADAFYRWAKPRVIDLWNRLKSEIEQRKKG
jgi:hypothetical protein